MRKVMHEGEEYKEAYVLPKCILETLPMAMECNFNKKTRVIWSANTYIYLLSNGRFKWWIFIFCFWKYLLILYSEKKKTSMGLWLIYKIC